MPTHQPKLRTGKEPAGNLCKLTPRGWALLFISSAACILGFLYAFSSILLLGLTGLILLALALPWARANLEGLTLSRHTPDRSYAGQSFSMEIILKNGRAKLDGFAIDCEDGVAGPSARGMAVDWVKNRGEARRKCETRLLRRGVAHQIRSALESSFPLGLWKVRRDIREVHEMVIYPRSLPPRILEDPEFLTMLEADEAESLQYDTSGDFHGVREFQPGDRLKHICWPTTARSQKLMVRQFDRRLPSRYMILFHSAASLGRTAHGEAFDAAMEMLCGLLNFAHQTQMPVDLITSFNNWKALTVEPTEEGLHAALTLLAGARRKPESDLRPLADMLMRAGINSRVFILSDVSVKEWESAIPELPCLVTCLSVADLRVRQPRLSRRMTPSSLPA